MPDPSSYSVNTVTLSHRLGYFWLGQANLSPCIFHLIFNLLFKGRIVSLWPLDEVPNCGCLEFWPSSSSLSGFLALFSLPVYQFLGSGGAWALPVAAVQAGVPYWQLLFLVALMKAAAPVPLLYQLQRIWSSVPFRMVTCRPGTSSHFS